jgi:hypothetical protein
MQEVRIDANTAAPKSVSGRWRTDALLWHSTSAGLGFDVIISGDGRNRFVVFDEILVAGKDDMDRLCGFEALWTGSTGDVWPVEVSETAFRGGWTADEGDYKANESVAEENCNAKNCENKDYVQGFEEIVLSEGERKVESECCGKHEARYEKPCTFLSCRLAASKRKTCAPF